MMKRLIRECTGGRCAMVTGLAIIAAFAAPALAQQVDLGTEAYIEPSEQVLEAVTAPWHENVTLSDLSPDGAHFLITLSDGMPPLAQLARPYVNLGEMTIDHIANRSRRFTTRNSPGIELRTVNGNETRNVRTPDDARISNAQWSPDGSMIAYFAHTDDATHIYVADVETGRSRQVTRRPVNAVHVTSFDWSGDSAHILTVLTPANRGEMPQPPDVATEPQVRINRDGATPTRLYRFLMKAPYDFELYEWLSTGQLALINVHDRTVTAIGEPKMFTAIDLSPGADLFEVTTVLKPFVYYSTARGFGSLSEIWNADGEVIHELRRRELESDDDDEQRWEDPQLDEPEGLWPGDVDPAAIERNERREQQARGRGRGGPGAGGGANVGDDMRSISWRPDGNGISYLHLEPEPEENDDVDNDDQNGDTAQDADNTPPQRGRRGRRGGGRRGGGGGAQGGGTFLGIPVRAGQDQDADSESRENSDEPAEAIRKDRLMQWSSPYGEDDKAVVYQTEGRILSVEYSDDCRTLFITETKDDNRISFALNLDDPDATKHIYRGGDDDDDAGDDDNQAPPARGRRGGRGGGGQQADRDAPGRTGNLMTRPGPMGMDTVRMSTDGAHIYFSGTLRSGNNESEQDDDTANNPRSFIDQYEITTGEAKRLFVTEGDMTERITAVQGDDITAVFTTRESSTVIPDTWRYDLPQGDDEENDDDSDEGDDDSGDDVEADDDGPTQLTHNTDFLPDLTRAKRDRFQVTRVDGKTFWVEVTIPRGYGKELPAMFWFYPREYTSQQQYDQRAGRGGGGGAGTFPRIRQRSMDIWTRLGYVVVEPDLPIFGEEGRMNDNYVQDLRNGLWAVIDELDRREIIDRDRLAIGGHSYGAFGTANAMIHTPFFKAGIAGDGNFNRTLTPMAFQSERRFLWDARETYFAMSPLLWANQLNGALLMYHGIEDPNTGTHPFHAIRMFEALDGLGKDVSLYYYPYEEHGPLARETVVDQWARWEQWLEKYVKYHGEEQE